MPIEFGKVTDAWFGKSGLTKRIQAGFRLQARLNEDDLWRIAEGVCATYPNKKSVLGDRAMSVFSPTKDPQRTVGFGTVSKKTGGMAYANWSLRFRGTTPSWHIYLVKATLISGKIKDVIEMQFFLKEFEDALRREDPEATIQFVRD
jgi:hypothetical protein